MRNYIILNGNNSNTISGLLIQSLPPISKPLMRTAIEEIDGRDGDIVTNLGYSAYDKEVSIGLYGSYDVDEVIKYFNDNSKGQVTFSNEPDKYYNYEIINQIDFERLIRFKTAIVTLHCQPFKYPVNETPVEIAYQYVNNEAEEMDLDNTADAPMNIDLKGNNGKNLFDKDNANVLNANLSDGGTLSQTDNARTLYIPCKNNTTYTISKLQAVYFRVAEFANTPTIGSSYINRIKNDTANYITFTTTTGNYLAVTYWYSSSTNTEQQVLDSLQIEKGSTATDYEPYSKVSGDNTIEICGKNLFDKDKITSGYRIGNTGNNYADSDYFVSEYIKVKPNTKYTLSKNSIGEYNCIALYDNNKGFISRSGFYANTQYTFTTSNDTSYLRATDINENLNSLQIEGNEQKTTYKAYQGNSQLISLGVENLFDKDNANVLNGYFTQSSTTITSDNSNRTIYIPCKPNTTYTISKSASPNGRAVGYTTTTPEIGTQVSGVLNIDTNSQYKTITTGENAQYLVIRLWNSGQDTITIQQMLDSLQIEKGSKANSYSPYGKTPIELNIGDSIEGTIDNWYILRADTTTEAITDDTLIGQLNNLANARSYDTRTHITQNANDKPFMLNATAIQKGTDTGVVDNDGNIYSKPTLDIEGNGIVAIYLNGNQMFSVDLSNSNECIIDVTNLEAYDPETNELMNRQVTGDYSKFILPVGENQVKVSGNVTKATISGYTRWL